MIIIVISCEGVLRREEIHVLKVAESMVSQVNHYHEIVWTGFDGTISSNNASNRLFLGFKIPFFLSLFSGLSQVHCHVSEDLTQVINKNIAMLEGRFGVLLFLYSILLTKVNYWVNTKILL